MFKGWQKKKQNACQDITIFCVSGIEIEHKESGHKK
jgi:hypothetical protein